MIRRPPIYTRTDTPFPYTTPFRTALREVALELDAGGDHVLGTDRDVADARADLAQLVAADAAVAAGVEAQGWRHRGHRVGEGVADLAAHDPPVAFAQTLEPAGPRVHLGEARVRDRALHPAAQDPAAAA